MENTCNDPNCDRRARSRGLCKSHYEKWRVANRDKVDTRPGRWDDENGDRKPCQFPECPKPIKTQGLCAQHYSHFWYESTRGQTKQKKYRKLRDLDGTKTLLLCTFKGCTSPEFNPGLCGGHYYQSLRGEELRPIREKAVCPIEGCDALYSVKLTTRGLCSAHSDTCKRFSLTPEQLISMHQSLVCGNPGCDTTVRLHIDHDHNCCPPGKFGTLRMKSCGKCVRGWLCHACNVSLGQLQEDPRRIRGLLEWINA